MKKYLLGITVITALFGSSTVDAQPDAPDITLDQPAESAPDAQPAPIITPERTAEDPISATGEMIKDVREGDWRHAAAGLLTLLMLGLSTAREKTKWFSGDRAGAGLVIGLSLAGAFVTLLASPLDIDMRLVLNALSIAAESAGGYVLIKKLIWPTDSEEKAT